MFSKQLLPFSMGSLLLFLKLSLFITVCMYRTKKLDLSSHLDEGPKNTHFAIFSPSGIKWLLLQLRIFSLFSTLSPLNLFDFQNCLNVQ